MTDDDEWTRACPSEDIVEGSAWPIQVNGQEICLYRIDGKVYATHDRCTHGNANLSGGILEGHAIECPFHQGRFDVRTGEPIMPPCTTAIKTFAVRERDGVIWLKVL